MQALNVTNLPIYLPLDTAEIPFGDPIQGATFTLASPSVVSVPGYVPVNGAALQFAVSGAGALPAAFTAGVTYYVVGANAAAGTFNLSATKGGAAINAAQASTAPVTARLVSGQVDGPPLPFKTTGSVVVLNPTAGALVLQGAPDVNAAGVFGLPGGPGAFTTLATVPALSAVNLASLSADWIRVSTAATLILLQN